MWRSFACFAGTAVIVCCITLKCIMHCLSHDAPQSVSKFRWMMEVVFCSG